MGHEPVSPGLAGLGFGTRGECGVQGPGLYGHWPLRPWPIFVREKHNSFLKPKNYVRTYYKFIKATRAIVCH
jgi:hypothetical protein